MFIFDLLKKFWAVLQILVFAFCFSLRAAGDEAAAVVRAAAAAEAGGGRGRQEKGTPARETRGTRGKGGEA